VYLLRLLDLTLLLFIVRWDNARLAGGTSPRAIMQKVL